MVKETKKDTKIVVSRSLILTRGWAEIERDIATIEEVCPPDRRQKMIIRKIEGGVIYGWKTEKGNIHMEIRRQ